MTQYWKATQSNADAMSAVVDRAKKITEAEAEKLAAAWRAAGGDDLDAAWNAAWTGGDAAWAAWGAYWTECVEGGAARNHVWRVAGVVAAGAARAAAVRDLITPEQYRILAGPWESVMGPIFKEVDA